MDCKDCKSKLCERGFFKGSVWYPNIKEQWMITEFKRDLEIIQKLYDGAYHLPRGKNRTRFNFAIYRLYRECNLSPLEIKNFIKFCCGLYISYSSVKRSIGRVFKNLCIKNNCIFKEFLLNKYEIRRI